ncbi:Alpha/Beta hydrolase protein [Mycena crocata]|nr:Alpha/Beta hydrolase protein [Mycena crocata]
MDDSLPQVRKSKMKQLVWPDPLVVPPISTHTHSIILLHGRGSNAERFGLELLNAQSSDRNKTLRDHFPGMKFLFPTAKKRRAVVFNRTPINQWFDLYSLENPSERQHLQYDGLRETSGFLRGLINREAQVVGASNVILGGLSQGCAAALHVLLNFQPENGCALLGFVGMSGWLPFAEMLDADGGVREEEDIFGATNEDPEHTATSVQLRAVNTARDIASSPPLGKNELPVFTQTPIFLGHGIHDQKVPLKLGEMARDVMQRLGCKVQWKDYDEGHWYKVPDEIDDLVAWLNQRINA